MQTVKPDYKHTYLLFALIGLVLVAGLILKAMLVPETYGEKGNFRAAALDDARAAEPRHLGVKGCAECHEKQVALHAKDAHGSVNCEACHGAGWKHAADPEKHPVVTPEGKQICLSCHQHLAARPGWFPQVRWREHYRFVGVKDEQTACTACHDPHEPLFMDRDLRQARLHPLVHRCRDCHTGRVNANLPRPDGHPAIFKCNYCHSGIVTDFSNRTHAKVRCTTCHLFFRESDYSGRILRDADPRFCLLCHRDAEFRSDAAPPGIVWPDHLEDVAEEPGDQKKRCVDCHQDRIHLTGMGKAAPGSTSPPPKEEASAPDPANKGDGAKPDQKTGGDPDVKREEKSDG
jgi:hypothetical protein